MFINRGIPGSGKSTLSKQIIHTYGVDEALICSADDYHLNEKGEYSFFIENLPKAHEACQKKAKNCCEYSLNLKQI
jgi:uridine kinase